MILAASAIFIAKAGDLTITHEEHFVVQATDYGVWGDVIREQKSDIASYRYGYQGQFAEKDEETGWSHFELREYDAVIGRWTVVDPKRIGWSPYIGMYNNPVGGIDPDGGGPTDYYYNDKEGLVHKEGVTGEIDGYKWVAADDATFAEVQSAIDVLTGPGVIDVAGQFGRLSEFGLFMSSLEVGAGSIIENASSWRRVTSSYGISFRYISTSGAFKATAIGDTPLAVRLSTFAGAAKPWAGWLGNATTVVDVAISADKFSAGQMGGYRFAFKLGTGGASLWAGSALGAGPGMVVGGTAFAAEKTWDHFIRPALWDFSGKMIEMRNALANGWPYRQLTNR